MNEQISAEPETEREPEPEPTPELAPSLAAIHLSSQLGGTQELWLYRLANWRRPGRRSPVAYCTTEAGHPAYALGALNDFVAKQLNKQGLIAEAATTAPVRAVAIAFSSKDEKPHVRVSFAIRGASQSMFAISAPAARQLASMLTKAATLVEHAAPEGSA